MGRIIMSVAASTALIATVALTQGCSTSTTPTGLSSPRGGLLYTGVTYGSVVQEQVIPAKCPFKVLGKVNGTSSATSILCLVNFGDCGVQAAVKDALERYPGAQDICDLKIDSDVTSVLMVFSKVTTHVSGWAVTYDMAYKQPSMTPEPAPAAAPEAK